MGYRYIVQTYRRKFYGSNSSCIVYWNWQSRNTWKYNLNTYIKIPGMYLLTVEFNASSFVLDKEYNFVKTSHKIDGSIWTLLDLINELLHSMTWLDMWRISASARDGDENNRGVRVGLAPNWLRFVHKWDKSGTFYNQFQYIFLKLANWVRLVHCVRTQLATKRDSNLLLCHILGKN